MASTTDQISKDMTTMKNHLEENGRPAQEVSRWKSVNDLAKKTPLVLAASLFVPMISIQLFGVPGIAKLIEAAVLPENQTLGVARIGLAPIDIDRSDPFAKTIYWSELLLLTHSAAGPRDITILSAESGMVGVSAGAIEPRPNLEGVATTDPRTQPLFRVTLPRKKLMAALVHLDSQSDRNNRLESYWAVDGKAEAPFHRESSNLIAMTENEYIALILVFIFAVILSSVGSIVLVRAPRLSFSSDESLGPP